MSEIEVVRTYKIQVDDEVPAHVRGLGGSVAEMLIAITHLIDGGNHHGEVHMIYYWDTDAELGCYEWFSPDDYEYDSGRPIVAKVKYRGHVRSMIGN